MPAEIIDGKKIAEDIRAELKSDVEQLSEKGIVPGLAMVLVGDDPASEYYVSSKKKACAALGIHTEDHHLSESTTQAELLELVEQLNANPEIHGILVQLPLPGHMEEATVLEAVDPNKDVDGFHPTNIGTLLMGGDAFLPCTPHGVVQLLLRSDVEIPSADVVVIGRSNLVGKPLATMLMQKQEGADATVTLCHSRTKNLSQYTKQADIIVSATGCPNTVTAEMVKPGVVIIDVGINRVNDQSVEKGYRVVGDVDFEGVREVASKITPVPGGVGPMTITMLLFNTIESAKRANGVD